MDIEGLVRRTLKLRDGGGLPAPAAKKLADMEAAAAAAKGADTVAAARAADANATLHALRQELARRRETERLGAFATYDPVTTISTAGDRAVVQRTIATDGSAAMVREALEAVKVAEAHAEAAVHAWNSTTVTANAFAEPLAELRRWLDSADLSRLRAFVGQVPTDRQAGEAYPAAVMRARRRLDELKADQHRVRSAPIPAAEAKTRIRATVGALAVQGRPNVSRVLEGGEIAWKFNAAPSPYNDAVTAGGVKGSVLSLLAFLLRDEMVAKLEAEIDAVANDGAALDDAQKAAETKRIEADILATERSEEALIAEAQEREGAVIPRRFGASPLAVLGLEVVP